MSNNIVIADPSRNFGKPMFAASGAPVEDVLDRLRAGESLASVAKDFGLNPEEVTYCDKILFNTMDIADRLRRFEQQASGYQKLQMLCGEAADEVELLREKVQDLRMYAEQDACEIDQLRTEMSNMADWIVNQFGYPLDTTTVDSPPAVWRKLIEEAWLRSDLELSAQERSSMSAVIAEQGGWKVGDD